MVEQAATIKEINQIRILNLLRLYPGASRTDIVRMTGLTKGAISPLVAELMHDGLIEEVGKGVQLAAPGRPAIQLQLNAETRVAIGIELTGSRCVAVLADLYSRPVRETQYDVCGMPLDGWADVISRAVEELMEGFPKHKLLGVGVGLPALVDRVGQRILRADNFPSLPGAPLGQMLADRLGTPVKLARRQASGALGEHWYGIGRDRPNLVFISVDVGIGCGILLDGKLYEGSDGLAGEIGHVIAAAPGQERLCTCGNRGCLETIANLPAMATHARAKIEAGQESLLRTWTGGDLASLSGHDVVAAARQGDPVAVAVVQQAARDLGCVVATLVSLLNLSLVVIGGDIAELGDCFLDPLRETVRQRAYPGSAKTVEVVPSSLGHLAAAVGAATSVIDDFFTLAVPGFVGG